MSSPEVACGFKYDSNHHVRVEIEIRLLPGKILGVENECSMGKSRVKNENEC